MAKRRTRPLRFLVTGALLVGPMACGDTPIEDLPTHNEAPLPEDLRREVQEPAAETSEQEQEAEAAPDLIGDPGLELNSNAVPPHLQPPSPLNASSMTRENSPED